MNDAWITNGMARYGELMYIEDESGKNALHTALQDVSASALAYDTIPLSSIGRQNPFSPEFQSMTLDKGAMIFHMLRWEIGDKAFLATLKGALSQYTDSPIRAADFEKVAESQSQQQLTAFFAQWVDGTGAPQFTNKYAVYRLGNNKGFRTIGEIGQDLDLFRMPVELRVETDGKTESQKIEVVGTDTPHQHRSRQLGAQVHPRPAGAHRHPEGPATGGAGRPDRRTGRIPEGSRSQPAEFAGQLPHRRSPVLAA
jgi:aminopeptidase N